MQGAWAGGVGGNQGKLMNEEDAGRVRSTPASVRNDTAIGCYYDNPPLTLSLHATVLEPLAGLLVHLKNLGFIFAAVQGPRLISIIGVLGQAQVARAARTTPGRACTHRKTWRVRLGPNGWPFWPQTRTPQARSRRRRRRGVRFTRRAA